MPSLQRVILERPPVGETDLPRFGPGQAVDCVQMDSGHPILLATRQEHDAGHMAAQAAQCRGCDCPHDGLAGALFACNYHVWFEQDAFQRYALLEESIKHSVQHPTGDLLAALDRMGSVHQHLRLDDRNEILFLTERGVPRQRVRIRANAGGARQSVSDMDDRPPLGEAGTHAMVLREAVPMAVKFANMASIRAL